MFGHAIVWMMDASTVLTNLLIASMLLIFAPMSFTGKMRGVAQVGFAVSALLLSLILWINSAFTVYAYAGLIALILSLLIFAVPTVLVACFEELIHHDWYSLIGTAVMTTAITGAAFGFWKCERRAMSEERPYTMFVDPPGPFSPIEELRAFLRDTEHQANHPDIRSARNQVLDDLRRREQNEGADSLQTRLRRDR